MNELLFSCARGQAKRQQQIAQLREANPSFVLDGLRPSELLTSVWKWWNTNRCPRCNRPVSKNGGCPQVRKQKKKGKDKTQTLCTCDNESLTLFLKKNIR